MTQKYKIMYFAGSKSYQRLLAFWSEGFAIGLPAMPESEYELFEWSEMTKLEIVHTEDLTELWISSPGTLVHLQTNTLIPVTFVKLSPPKSKLLGRPEHKNGIKMRTAAGETISIIFDEMPARQLINLLESRISVNEDGVLLTVEAKLAIREDLREALKYSMRKAPPLRGNSPWIFPSDEEIMSVVPRDSHIHAVVFGTLENSMTLNPLNKMASHFSAWVLTGDGLFIISKGHFFAAQVGTENDFIPLNRLGGASIKTTKTGFNTLTTQGLQGEEKIGWVVKGSATFFQEALRDLLTSRTQHSLVSHSQPTKGIAEQIRELGDLLEDGLITQDEFEQQKKKILKSE
jgi:hypothetical protein